MAEKIGRVFQALRRARRGVGLLEISLGLVIMAIGGATFAVMQNNATQAQRAQVAGEALNEVHEAARLYVQANRAALLSSVPVGGAPVSVLAGRPSATDAVPAGSLQALGFMPSGWVDRNVYGHRHVVLIRQPTAGTLDVLVVQQGGQEIRPQDLTRVASRAGAAGGIVPTQAMPSAPTTHATGMGGAWSLPRSQWVSGSWQPQAGRAVAYASFPPNANETNSGSFLSRVNTGNPDDTRMQTDLDMGGRSIGAAAAVNANQMTANAATVYGNAWMGGNVDAFGLYARDWLNSHWITARGDMWANGWVSTGALNARGHIQSDGGVLLRNTVNEGWGCWENGLMGRAPDGSVMTCQGGVFRRPSAAAFRTVVSDYWSGTMHTIWNHSSSAALVTLAGGGYFEPGGYTVTLGPWQGINFCGGTMCDGDGRCWCSNSHASTRITVYR